MKKSSIISAILILSSILSLNSCKKKAEEADSETQSVVDNAICEQQFMAIAPVINEKGINQAGIKKTNSCGSWTILGAVSGTNTPNVSSDTIVDVNGNYQNGPVSFLIDYGTGCLSFDGLSFKTGVIKITTAKRWSADSNVVTIDLQSYKVNNITYSGQVKISRSDAVTFSMEVINGHCTDGSWNIDYACNKTIKQIAGFNTKNDESDDVISITGNSTGVNREGRTFSTSITSVLNKKSSCKWITSGTLELTPEGFKTRTVDFGAGGCDDDATYTVNGQTISFKLK